MNARRPASLLCACALLAGSAPPAAAEFYRWVDAHGQVRVSNVPPPQVRNDGRLPAPRHPWGPATQNAGLRERLAARDAELAAAASDTAAPAARSE